MLLGSHLGKGGYDNNKYYVEQLHILFKKKKKKEIIDLTEKSMDIHKILNSDALAPKEKNIYQQQLAVIEDGIENLIYELYDLSEEDIAIIGEIINYG